MDISWGLWGSQLDCGSKATQEEAVAAPSTLKIPGEQGHLSPASLWYQCLGQNTMSLMEAAQTQETFPIVQKTKQFTFLRQV